MESVPDAARQISQPAKQLWQYHQKYFAKHRRLKK